MTTSGGKFSFTIKKVPGIKLRPLILVHKFLFPLSHLNNSISSFKSCFKVKSCLKVVLKVLKGDYENVPVEFILQSQLPQMAQNKT